MRTLSNRSGDQEPGQEDCELRHQRDRSSCEHGSAEDLEANRVGWQVVRALRRIVQDEHDSFIEDKKTKKRILVELTRGDVF